MFKKIKIFAFIVFMLNIGYGFCHSINAFAYTATLSVPSYTEIDVSAVGNGATVSPSDIVVDSTCPLGYTLSIVGPADSTLYKNGDNTETSMIPASSGTLDSPASILGNNIGTWGYTLDSDASINSGFVGLTNFMTDILTKDSASEPGGDTIALSYGVSVPYSLPSGEYTLTESSAGAGDDAITYLLTPNPNCSTIKLIYDDNGAYSPTSMSISQIIEEDDVITLVASNFQRPGYGFAGWSLRPLDADSDSFQYDLYDAVSNGDVFGPNEDIIIDSHILSNVFPMNNELVVSLYAIWVKAEEDVTLQTWTGCNTMAIGDVIALEDERDYETYAVAKLADNNCWMIENLRLDDSADFTESLSQGFGKSTTYGNFIGLAESETADFSNSTTTNSIYYSGTQSGTASIDIGTGNYPGYRFPRYRNDNTDSPVSDMTTPTDVNIYSYGNYYTWSSALANTIYYSAPAATDADGKTSETVGTSLCPAGWRLPYGRSYYDRAISGGFSNLDMELGGIGGSSMTAEASLRWRTYPNNFLYSGYTEYSYVRERGSFGYYWSSTAYGYDSSYDLTLYDSGLSPGTGRSSRYYGRSIRCVASQYTIAFNANGGSGTMNSQTAILDVATTLDSSTLTAPTGKVFDSWNTAADGSGTSYADGASVTNLTVSGNTITLYAQWVCGPGYICYDDNGANSPTKMSSQAVGSSDTEATLWASNYQRSGYGFAGWNTAADGSGTNYGPNETIDDTTVLSTIQSTGITLYAKWVQSTGDLQSWDGCSSLVSGAVTALTDTRDNETYAVAKLADDNCWMIENLRLGDVDSDGDPIILSSINTNNPSLPLNNSDGTTSNSLSSSSDPDSASSPWCGSGIACANQSIMYAGNSDETVGDMTNVNANVYSYGNYYNWYSATAGKGEYGVSFVTDGDLCPTGWHLPYGGPDTGPTGGQSSGGFLYLDVQLGGTGGNQSTKEASLRWRAYPNNFVYSGSITSGSNMSVTGRGSYGVYWSSTGASNTQAGVVMIGDTALRLGYPDYKYSGNMARCVLSN